MIAFKAEEPEIWDLFVSPGASKLQGHFVPGASKFAFATVENRAVRDFASLTFVNWEDDADEATNGEVQSFDLGLMKSGLFDFERR